MSQSYLVPIVQQTINGIVASVPKYSNTALAGLNYSSIRYGLESLALVTLARANSALQTEPDVYTFNPDLTVPMSDEDAAVLDGFLNANNLPSDGILSGLPFVTALVYVAQIHLLAQYVAGSTNQSGSIFANGVTLNSPASSVPALSAMLSVSVQSAQVSQGVGNVGIGTGGSGGSSGGSGGSSSGPFNFSSISNSATVGEFLDAGSQTWTGGPISLGGFA
jgi:hypothetical protein